MLLVRYVADRSERYQTYCERIWEICSTSKEMNCVVSASSSRSDGTDRNGNSGDYKGCGEGDQSQIFVIVIDALAARSVQKTEPDDPDC